MDIFNINIHHITRQYLEYIKTMRRLDLEVAGEFVAMAATLLHIKSRMLLPQYNEEGEEVSEDPRKELVQKLLEYKRFRELSVDLYKRPLLGRDVFTRASVESIEALQEGELILEDNPLFSLIASYRSALKNMKKTVHRVAGELQSIAARILEIKDRLLIGQRVIFRDLITETENRGNQVLVTFLSILELAKMGFISVFQADAFTDIHVETKKVIDRDIVSQVESYDSVNAAQKADQIMVEAQLSLSEPAIMLEGEEAPVVEALPVDAASDAEIEAEEAALETVGHQDIIPHDTVQSLLPEEVATDDEIELELAKMAAEDRGEVFVPPVRQVPTATVEPFASLQMLQELPGEGQSLDFVEAAAETGSAELTGTDPVGASAAPEVLDEDAQALGADVEGELTTSAARVDLATEFSELLTAIPPESLATLESPEFRDASDGISANLDRDARTEETAPDASSHTAAAESVSVAEPQLEEEPYASVTAAAVGEASGSTSLEPVEGSAGTEDVADSEITVLTTAAVGDDETRADSPENTSITTSADSVTSAVASEVPATEEASLADQDAQPVEMTEVMAQPTVESAAAETREPVVAAAEAPSAESLPAATEPAVAEPTSQKRNVTSALSAALSAFDAFNDMDNPKPTKPPEVES